MNFFASLSAGWRASQRSPRFVYEDEPWLTYEGLEQGAACAARRLRKSSKERS
jgi:hypothetical protein